MRVPFLSLDPSEEFGTSLGLYVRTTALKRAVLLSRKRERYIYHDLPPPASISAE
jgi:hypothetical protein